MKQNGVHHDKDNAHFL